MVGLWRSSQKSLRNIGFHEEKKKKAGAKLASTFLWSPNQTPNKWVMEPFYHSPSFWEKKTQGFGGKGSHPEAGARAGSSFLLLPLERKEPEEPLIPSPSLSGWPDDLLRSLGVDGHQQCRDCKRTFELELHCLQKGKMSLQCSLGSFFLATYSLMSKCYDLAPSHPTAFKPCYHLLPR